MESATCFAGTPDDVYTQIKGLNDRVGGFGHLLFFGQGGFLDHADTVANITLFAKAVLPRLRELNGNPSKPPSLRHNRAMGEAGGEDSLVDGGEGFEPSVPRKRDRTSGANVSKPSRRSRLVASIPRQ